MAEAQRLSEKHGVNFIVMEAIARVRVKKHPIEIDYPAGAKAKALED